MKYALVVVRIPLDRPFTYRIPKKIEEYLSIGKRVWVPFGHRRLLGYVVGITDNAEIKNVKFTKPFGKEKACVLMMNFYGAPTFQAFLLNIGHTQYIELGKLSERLCSLQISPSVSV